MRFFSVLFLLFAMAGSAIAQCPGGSCPVQTTRVVQRAHWTYPGALDEHLRGAHGQNVSGMTRGQMLDLHDALHEGRAGIVRRTAAAPVQAVQRTTTRVATRARYVGPVRRLFGWR